MCENKRQTIEIGTKVYLPGTNRVAEVVEIASRGKKCLLRFGPATSWAKIEELEPVSEGRQKKSPLPSSPRRPIRGKVRSRASVLSIDLHGHTVDEATTRLERTVDKALLDGCSLIEVIHGIGTGALKDAVHSYLQTSKHVRSYKLDDLNPGTTLVYL